METISGGYLSAGDAELSGRVRLGLLRRRAGMVVAAVVLAPMALAAIVPSALAPSDPNRIDLAHRLQSPTPSHLLGTDQFGRDLLSRVIFGSRWTLGGALLVLVATVVIGGAAAVAATLGPRLLRVLVARMIDLFLALPHLILAFAIVGALGPGFFNTLLALAVTGWAGEARLLRGLLLAEVDAPYTRAARAAGASTARIVLRELVPAIGGRSAVVLSLRLGYTILALSSLSFLGLGAQPPAAEWGAMLADARSYLLADPTLMIVPGVAVVLAVAASNVLADSLSNALDARR